MFRTKFDEDKKSKVFSNPGDMYKTEYQLRVVDNNDSLEPVGESNLYDYIQSHADSVDLHKILERCALVDDYSILNRMPGRFMDVTEMPKNLADAYSMIQDAKAMFDRMPLDIKEAYDSNFVEFIADLGSKRFDNLVGDFLEKEKLKEAAKDITVVNEEIKNES